MNIYIGNLPTTTDDNAVRKAFETFGEVAKVNLIKDRFTQELRGFGFVEMPVQKEGMEAIELLNGSAIDGKDITVNEAKPRKESNGNGGSYGDNKRW